MENTESTLQETVEAAISEALASPTQNEALYTSIDEYRTVTGKRFRMTKEEKSSGLSREQAFTARFQ